MKVKTLHMFDRNIFRKNWKKINDTPLKKAGLYVRKIAIQSIRRDQSKSKRPSKPGRPPKTRASGDPIRRIFSVPSGGGVIVGAVKLSSRSSEAVPGLHEHGGSRSAYELLEPERNRPTTAGQRAAFRKLVLAGDSRVTAYLRQNKRKPRKIRVSYPPRPFMAPALEKALPKLPEMWQGAIR